MDGVRHEFWHNGIAGPARWSRDWQSGDVISFALDFHTGSMKFALNGQWERDLERNFAANGRALFPALSSCGTFEIFISKDKWNDAPVNLFAGPTVVDVRRLRNGFKEG